MAKPSKVKEPVTFRAWLMDPEMYVRRGELVQVVEWIIQLNALKNETFWQRMKRKFKGA